MDVVKHFADDILIVHKEERSVREALKKRQEFTTSSKGRNWEKPAIASEGRGKNNEEKRREIRAKANSKPEGDLSNWRTSSAGGKMIQTLRLLLQRVREAGLRLQLKKMRVVLEKDNLARI